MNLHYKRYYLTIFLVIIFKIISAQNRIHWGTLNTPLDGLTITWNSEQQNDSIRWGYSKKQEKGIFTSTARDGLNIGDYWHDYTFPSVKPSSIIYYSIKNDGKWSIMRAFKTASDPNSEKISFIAGGDSRNDDIGNPHFDKWGECADSLAAINVDFHLFLGDHVDIGKHVDYGDEKVWWGEWFDKGSSFLESHLLYHTPGNNEYANTGSVGSQIYLNQFVLPDEEKWYSFEYGDAFFLCLYSETGSSDFELQFPWMKEALEKTNKKWKIVFFHRPFYSSKDNHLESLFDTWWQAFDDNGVDIILNGHTHFYLRTKPINRNINTETAVKKYGSNADEGRMEIIAGSYGAPLKTATYEDNWYVDNNQLVYNYTKITIEDTVLLFNAYNMYRELIDSVRLIKNDTSVTLLEKDSRVQKIPQKFCLNNYPNPFNPSTIINFNIPKSGQVKIVIYDINGREVNKLVNGFLNQGSYEIKWNAENRNGSILPGGMYIARIKTSGYDECIKMLLIK